MVNPYCGLCFLLCWEEAHIQDYDPPYLAIKNGNAACFFGSLFSVGCLTLSLKFFRPWFPFLYTPSKCSISWFCFTSFYKKYKGAILGPMEGIDPFIWHVKLETKSIIYKSTDILYFQFKSICSMKRRTREWKGKLHIGRKYIQTKHLIKVVSILS